MGFFDSMVINSALLREAWKGMIKGTAISRVVILKRYQFSIFRKFAVLPVNDWFFNCDPIEA